jgi:hypothetical protein
LTHPFLPVYALVVHSRDEEFDARELQASGLHTCRVLERASDSGLFFVGKLGGFEPQKRQEWI